MAAVIGGVVAIILGVVTLFLWGTQFLTVLLGSIPIILIVGGGIAIAAGIVTIKDKAAAEQIIEDDSLSDIEEEDLDTEGESGEEENETDQT